MPYRDMVQALQVSRETFQISARSDAYTDDPDSVRRYALAKIAEETVESGYDLFEFRDQANRNVSGSLKPGQTLWVKMSRYPAPTPLPPGMFDAHDVTKLTSGNHYEPPQPSR